MGCTYISIPGVIDVHQNV